jgi:RND family efflux transporter MFP subunit
VAYDETKITHIHTKVSGYVEDVFADFVGKSVKAGEPLFTIYSPDLVATEQEYLLALKSNVLLKDSAFPWVATGSNNLVEAARQRLLLWDITPEEIQSLEQSGEVKRALPIQSHVSGIVTERQAYHHGKYVTPEMDLYTIVDLSTVWVLGEIYETDLSSVRVGEMVQIELPYSSNLNSRRGRIIFISPTLDPKTRTAEVRVEFSNPDMALKPDMFVNFKLNIPLGRQLAVPAEAVLDTGTLQYVFIDKGQGYFEPREVKVGARTDDVVSIESGLKAGEQVVTSANFIIDSESRLKGVFATMGEPTRVPVGAPPGGAQNLQVEVLEPKTAKSGSNAIRILVKDSSGKPIEGAQVQVGLFMPQMGSMPPMSSDGTLKDEGGGVYSGTIEFLMAWTWETTVTVKKNGQIVGTAKTTITAR